MHGATMRFTVCYSVYTTVWLIQKEIQIFSCRSAGFAGTLRPPKFFFCSVCITRCQPLTQLVRTRNVWYRYKLPRATIPLRTHNVCSRPLACCWSVSRHADNTSQFPRALAAPFSVFIGLCSDDKISWLGGWASQWRPPQTQCHAICAALCSYCLRAMDERDSKVAVTCRLAWTRWMCHAEHCMKCPGIDKLLEGNQCHAL